MTFWSDHRGIIYGVRTIRVYELIQDLPYKSTIVYYIINVFYAFSAILDH